jgi:hypothetical protein
MAITDHIESVALDSPITPNVLPDGESGITLKKTKRFGSSHYARSLHAMQQVLY